jgi:hypothetical protein
MTGVELRSLLHVSAFLGGGVPLFEIRDTAGPATSMLSTARRWATRSRRPWAPRRWFSCADDSTINRAHRHAAGARRDPAKQVEPPGDEPADHGLGRSRGGLSTKIHLVCEQGRGPLAALITAGQRGDSLQFIPA